VDPTWCLVCQTLISNLQRLIFKVKIKKHIHEVEKLQEATERNHRQEIQRLLKDTNEKEEELLKQIDERGVKIRALEDTSITRLDDKALLKTFHSMDQPKMTLEDKTVKKNFNNSSGHGQSIPCGPTPLKMGTFTVYVRGVQCSTMYMFFFFLYQCSIW
jgi:hypothetical protein